MKGQERVVSRYFLRIMQYGFETRAMDRCSHEYFYLYSWYCDRENVPSASFCDSASSLRYVMYLYTYLFIYHLYLSDFFMNLFRNSQTNSSTQWTHSLTSLGHTKDIVNCTTIVSKIDEQTDTQCHNVYRIT